MLKLFNFYRQIMDLEGSCTAILYVGQRALSLLMLIMNLLSLMPDFTVRGKLASGQVEVQLRFSRQSVLG